MKKKVVILFIFLLGLAWYTTISSITGNPRKAEECLAKAEELEAKGIYVDAITEYENALEYRPGDEGITLKMANAYLNTGNSKKYIQICKELAESNHDNPDPMNSLMDYYMVNGEEVDAVKYLKDYMGMYPENETAQNWLVQLKGTYVELYNRYDEIGDVYQNSMVVKTESGYGVADVLGAEILEPVFQEAQPFSEEGLALICKDGRYSYVDEDGQTRLVPDETYSDLHMLHSDRTIAASNGKYGYLDEKLEAVTELQWDQLTLIQDGMGAGQKDGKWALVNENGKNKTDYVYDDVIMDSYGFCFGQERAFVKQGETYQLVNKKGKRIGELEFDDAKCFSDTGYAAVCKDGLWGYIDKDGELLIDYKYEDAQSFHNGFAAVCEDGLWGYIDETGTLVIKPQFEQASAISEKRTAAVLENEEWKLIQLNWFE